MRQDEVEIPCPKCYARNLFTLDDALLNYSDTIKYRDLLRCHQCGYEFDMTPEELLHCHAQQNRMN